MLSKDELVRYDRQLRIFGSERQERLKSSSVLLVGVGGLGSIISLYLVAAGIGKLVLVDEGVVELSNLNRQVLYTMDDIGRYKVEVAKEKLSRLNPNVEIEIHPEKLTPELADKLVKKADLVVDGLDNWAARYILNKACVEHKKIFIHAGVHGLYGQLLVVSPGKGPCLACVFKKKPSVEEVIPILGPTPGVMASLEATEAIKIITGYGTPLIGKLLLYDGYRMEFNIVKVARDPKCPICSKLENLK